MNYHQVEFIESNINICLICLLYLKMMKYLFLFWIFTVPQELAYNLTSLRTLDLSINDLTNVPVLVHSLSQLKYFSQYSYIAYVLFFWKNGYYWIIIHLFFSLQRFRSLSLASNTISALTNNTFYGLLDKLDYLDIANLDLHSLEVNECFEFDNIYLWN